MLRPKLVIPILVLLAWAMTAQADPAFGPRFGIQEGDDFFLGIQGEFGRVIGPGNLVPSVDFGAGDGPPTILNLDLRFYAIPLPETGVRLYGSVGPSWQFSENDELGLSLTLGLHIPMRGMRRYNLEFRWGLGDLPEHKAALAVLFGF